MLPRAYTVPGPREISHGGTETLDYNYMSTYYGSFGANHPERAGPYYKPIIDWMDNARNKAQVEALLSHVTCPENALYYACHIVLQVECPAIVRDMYSHLPPLNIGTLADGETRVFTSWRNCSVNDSNPAGNYYIWPSEALEFWSPHMRARNTNADSLLAVAQASNEYFYGWLSRGVDAFASYVKTRGGAHTSASDVVNGLEVYLDYFQGPNFLPYANGNGNGTNNSGVGTTESVGMMQAVNEMLLYAAPTATEPFLSPGHGMAEYVVELFPFWPTSEAAAFTSLLAKGGHLVSATWDNVTRQVDDPVRIVAKYGDFGGERNRMSLYDPWASSTGASVSVLCGGSKRAVTAFGAIVSFDTIVGEDCLITKG